MKETKKCNVCNTEKPLSDFYYRKESGKYRGNCKKCKPIKNKEWLAARTSKVCTHCGKDKPLTDYHKVGGGKWHQSYCKPCDKIRKSKYAEENKEKVVAARRLYRANNIDTLSIKAKENYINNKEYLSNYGKIYREKNKENIKIRDQKRRVENRHINQQKMREYRAKNRERLLLNAKKKRDSRTPEQILKAKIYAKEWKIKNHEYLKSKREENRLEIREKKRIYNRMKTATDPSYKIVKNLRTRVRMALKGSIKSGSTIDLLGCSIEDFREYFEGLFTSGMSWEKFLKGEIHIDHRIPCVSFDLTDPEQQKRCFHYTNLQPLYVIDNLKKGIKINYKVCSTQ